MHLFECAFPPLPMHGLFSAAVIPQVIGMGIKLDKKLHSFTSNCKDGQENVKRIEAVAAPSIDEVPMTQSEKRDMLTSSFNGRILRMNLNLGLRG